MKKPSPLLIKTLAIAIGTSLCPPSAHAQSSAVELEPVTLQADGQEDTALSYRVPNSSTATRTSVPLTETPVSIQVIPRKFIDDTAALGLEDVYIYSSSVFEAGNTLNAQSEFLPIIRGFESPILYRNGMRASSAGAVDLANIETVEVLKGPASILFGAVQPGGIVNYTTKQPLATPQYELQQQFGSYNHYRTTVDATGPLSDDGTLSYRLNGAYQNSGSFRDVIDTERWTIAPSIAWRPNDQTEVIFELSYTDEELPYDSGVPLGFSGEPLVPINTFFGDASLNGRDLEDTFLSTRIEHELNDIWKLRANFQYHNVQALNESVRNRGVRGTIGAETVRQRYQNEDRRSNAYQLVLDATADFEAFDMDHSALFGIDLLHENDNFDRFRANLATIPITPNPTPGALPAGNRTPLPAFRSKLNWAGFYLQDQVALLDNRQLKLLAGGRYDYVEQEQSFPAIVTAIDTEFTARFGLMYEINDWVSPYASVSQSYQPQGLSIVDQTGNLLEPERGFQYEGGAKFSFFEDRLVSTLAFYHIDKKDVAVFDNAFFTATGNIAYFPGVEQSSSGMEIDVAGEITEELSLIAVYAYTDTEVIANPGAPGTVGQRLGNVPLHSARLWLAYDMPEDTPLAGLGFGAGLRFTGESIAQFDATRLEEYAVVDLGAWYNLPLNGGQVLKAKLNVRNLFDREYYVRASDQSIVHPGTPLTLVGSIGIEF